MKSLREYQKTDLDAIESALALHNGVMYQLPTGGGKSVITSYVVSNICSDPANKVLFLVHRKHLVNQMSAHLNECKVQNDIYSAKNPSAVDKQVVLASIQSAISPSGTLALVNAGFSHIIIDEAHRSMNPSYMSMITALKDDYPVIKLLGITATPYRLDGIAFDSVYDILVNSVESVRSLIEKGFLCKFRVFSTPVADFENEVKSAGGDFQMRSLSEYMAKPTILDHSVNSYKKFSDGRRLICFCVDRSHALSQMEAYIRAGYTKTAYIDAYTTESQREKIFRDFESGIIDMIFCIETLTEGLDLPSCNVVQLCRPTKSLVLLAQMIGRGLRPKDDGGDLVILDNSMNVPRLGMPDSEREWSLEALKSPVVIDKDKIKVFIDEHGVKHLDNTNVPTAELVEISVEEMFNDESFVVEMATRENNRISQDVYDIMYDKVVLIITSSGYDSDDFKIEKKSSYNKLNISVEHVKNKVAIEFSFSGVMVGITPELSLSHHRTSNDINVIRRMHYGQRLLGILCSTVMDDSDEHNIKFVKDLKDLMDSSTDLYKLKTEIKTKKRRYIEAMLDKQIASGKSWFVSDVGIKMSDITSNSRLYGKTKMMIIYVSNQKSLLVKNRLTYYVVDEDDQNCAIGNIHSYTGDNKVKLREIHQTNSVKKEDFVKIMLDGFKTLDGNIFEI